MNSTHRCEVVEVAFSPHPDADSLSIAQIFGGYVYVGRTADWVGVKKAVYVPPDNIISTLRPEFATYASMTNAVDGSMRVKAKKLRGVISFGLMVPVPDDTPLGEDWTERLGVTHYVAPLPGELGSGKKAGIVMGGEQAKEPGVNTGGYYDLEAGRRYSKQLLVPGERVFATEKCDGSQARYVYWDGEYHVSSRNYWWKRTPDYSHLTVEYLTARGVDQERAEDIVAKKAAYPPKVNSFWSTMERDEPLLKFLRDNPGVTVFGEMAGTVAQTKYFSPDRFFGFDIFRDGKFMDAAEFHACDFGFNRVPILSDMPYDFDAVCAMAEGTTLLPDAKPKTIREGVVVCPEKERHDHRLGRVKLKWISGSFLERS